MRLAVLVIAGCALTACAGAPAKNPLLPSRTIELPKRNATASHALVTLAPSKGVCELSGENGRYALAAQPGGRPLISIWATSTKMSIDENGNAFAEVTTPSFVMRGFVPREPSHVYPKKWLSIDGVYFPRMGMQLPIMGAHDGKLTLDLNDPNFVLANLNDRFVDVSCDAVTLSEDSADELRDTLPPQFAGPGRSAVFERREGVAISATFDGPPVGRSWDPNARNTSFPHYTKVLEQRGKRVRIADGTHVAGWVDARNVKLVPDSALQPEKEVIILASVHPSQHAPVRWCASDELESIPSEAPVRPSSHPPTLVCPRDVRVVVVAAESPDSSAVMGTIPAGRPIRVLEQGGDLTNLFLGDRLEKSQSPLAAFNSVRVATPSVDLSDCTPTNAFPLPSPDPEADAPYPKARPFDAISWLESGAIPHVLEAHALRLLVENDVDLIHCYDEGLRKNPFLSGTLFATFVVGADGRISNVTEHETWSRSLPSEKLARCVLGSLSSLTFPKPKTKTKTLAVTASFSLAR
jgi:hypothetical protein